jgi:hypothetical protein
MSSYAKLGYGSRQVAGSDLIHGRPVRTFGQGRTCLVEGCRTRLSLYNPKAWCSLHDHRTY